jgi:hypothetical protein
VAVQSVSRCVRGGRPGEFNDHLSLLDMPGSKSRPRFGTQTVQGNCAERLAGLRRGCQLVAKILKKQGQSNRSGDLLDLKVCCK